MNRINKGRRTRRTESVKEGEQVDGRIDRTIKKGGQEEWTESW